jgi:elongation factor P
VLEIIETPPAIKGSSASARTKTARLSTGLEVQVPEYLETGELIKVNTETGKYSSRA